MILLRRLRRMDRAELAWRARVAARTAFQRFGARLRPSVWDRVSPRDVLAAGIEPDAVRHAILSRPSRFVLDPGSRDRLRGAILAEHPGAARDAAARADRILTGAYDLLGYRGLRFGSGDTIDWHLDPAHNCRAPRRFFADVPYLDPAIGDHKVIWELNRHQHWLALGRACWLTGDHRYRARILRELESWLDANPPLIGINWASMLEIGFRSIAWTWAIHSLIGFDADERHDGAVADDDDVHDLRVRRDRPSRRDHRARRATRDAWLSRMLVALHVQLTHVERNLSYYFSPNTHLTGEALALYVVGSALPELAASGRWIDRGRAVLLAEIDRQVLPDGGHVERSSHYQRYTLDFYLLALLTARRTGDTVAIARFTDAVARLARFTRVLADDEGRLPLIGDDDGGMLWPLTGRACADVRDSLTLAAVLLGDHGLSAWGTPEEVFWLAGSQPKAAPIGPALTPTASPRSCALPDTGFVVLRDAEGSHAVLDAGAHGYMNAGHAHADALAVNLTLKGRPLLVDRGTSTYVMDRALRDRLRSSSSHNTLTIDGIPPSSPAGPFHWHTRTDATLRAVAINPAFDWAEAEHPGYTPLVHRRQILRAADGHGWFIVDDILGAGKHVIDTHWHFDPGWMITDGGSGAVCARHFDNETAWLLTGEEAALNLFLGDEREGLGWHAPVYGTLVPAWTARVRHTNAGPAQFVTWVGRTAGRPRMTRHIDADGSSTVVVRTQEATSTLRIGGRGFRVAHVIERHGQFHSLSLVQPAGVVAVPGVPLEVEVSEALMDLHIARSGATLTLWTSRTPDTITLSGPAAALVRQLRLNGRAFPLSGNSRHGRLLIRARDWHPAPENAAHQQPGEPFAEDRHAQLERVK